MGRFYVSMREVGKLSDRGEIGKNSQKESLELKIGFRSVLYLTSYNKKFESVLYLYEKVFSHNSGI